MQQQLCDTEPIGSCSVPAKGPGGGGRKEVLPCPHSPQAQDPAKMHIRPSASPLPSPRALGHHSLICPESPRLQLGSSWVPAGYWPISQESSGRACGFPSLCRAMGLSLVCIVQFLSIWLFWLCRLLGLAREEPLRDADPGLGLVIVGDRTSRAFVPLEIDAGQVPAGSLWDEGFISGGRMLQPAPPSLSPCPTVPKLPVAHP